MDRRVLMVIVVSLLFGLVVASIASMTLRAGGKAPEQTEMKDILLAARPLSIGVTVKPADVRVQKIPVAQFPKGAFSKVEEVVDRSVISQVLAEEAILDGRLAARGSGLGLAPVIPVGMRAVAVRVSDVTSVSGFVLPGMRVDVQVTGRPPAADGSMTTTCLQNILVLSAGTTVQSDARGQAIPSQTVTLLVTPEQAETLTLACNEGKIQLALRNATDQTIEKTPGRDIAELYGVRGRPKAPPPTLIARPRRMAPKPVVVTPALPPPPPPQPEVIIFRGKEKSVETVGRAREY
jgi:pilus assembly protein CpaB